VTQPPVTWGGALDESLFTQAVTQATDWRENLQQTHKAAAIARLRAERDAWENQRRDQQTAQVWGNWNVYTFYSSADTTETTVTNAVYGARTWIASTDSTVATTWLKWNTAYVVYNGDRPPVPAPLTAEQLRLAREGAEADLRAKHAKETAARERAKALLREFLDEQQRDTLDKHRWFEVVSPAGRRYRITQGRAGNVYLIEGGHQVMRYCIHPADMVPDEDTMLAQALMVRCAEDEFVNIANKTPLRAAA